MQTHILSTLLYYDVFRYPLTAREIFAFLPVNSVTEDAVSDTLEAMRADGAVHTASGYYSVAADVAEMVRVRRAMERYAVRHWRVALLMAHVIKRCPFVRSVMITGTLSKNLSARHLDIDYFVVTVPNRVWIARTLLILFKKIVLFNRRKYFCLNYFLAESSLEIPEKNLFTATEIAHAKVVYNTAVHDRFRAANGWVHEYFPNLRHIALPRVKATERPSVLARAFELPLRGRLGDALDQRLMAWWHGVWSRRYAELDDERRDTLFRVERTRSTAHGPDFSRRILRAFAHRCRVYDIPYQPPLPDSRGEDPAFA